jgi:hypothetical protein
MREDSRRGSRVRTLKAGKIIVNYVASVFDCTVRNLSDTGALLQIEGAMAIPEHVVVVIGYGATAERKRARVVRREVFGIGVKFED